MLHRDVDTVAEQSEVLAVVKPAAISLAAVVVVMEHVLLFA